MAGLTLPPLDDDDAERLRVRAVRNERTVEEEARHILHVALQVERATAPLKLGTIIHQRFKSVGGADLPHMPRAEVPQDPFAQDPYAPAS